MAANDISRHSTLNALSYLSQQFLALAYDKSLDLSECIFWEKIFFLVNMTFAVYISISGYTLIFGAKIESFLCPFSFWDTEDDGV